MLARCLRQLLSTLRLRLSALQQRLHAREI
jgi:hypothetical protein